MGQFITSVERNNDVVRELMEQDEYARKEAKKQEVLGDRYVASPKPKHFRNRHMALNDYEAVHWDAMVAKENAEKAGIKVPDVKILVYKNC